MKLSLPFTHNKIGLTVLVLYDKAFLCRYEFVILTLDFIEIADKHTSLHGDYTVCDVCTVDSKGCKLNTSFYQRLCYLDVC